MIEISPSIDVGIVDIIPVRRSNGHDTRDRGGGELGWEGWSVAGATGGEVLRQHMGRGSEPGPWLHGEPLSGVSTMTMMGTGAWCAGCRPGHMVTRVHSLVTLLPPGGVAAVGWGSPVRVTRLNQSQSSIRNIQPTRIKLTSGIFIMPAM